MADILLAGGDQAERDRLSMLLACYGYPVRPEEGVRSAALAHRRLPAELLILDLRDARDADAVGVFRRENEELPILALTAGAPTFVAALDAGADAALAMPVCKLRLLDTVDRLLACFAAESPARLHEAA